MIHTRYGIIDSIRFASAPPAPSFPTDGLIARYQFENDLTNSYGVADNLINLNSPATYDYVSGKVNTGIFFDAISLYESVYNTDSNIVNTVSGYSSGSISFWFKIYDTNATDTCFWYIGGSSSTKCGIAVWKNSGGAIQTGMAASGNTMSATVGVNTVGSYNDDTWHHCTVCWGPYNLQLYIDGTLNQARYDQNYNFSITSKRFRINGSASAGSQLRYATLDQFYIYNRIIDSTEVAQLYNSGNGI